VGAEQVTESLVVGADGVLLPDGADWALFGVADVVHGVGADVDVDVDFVTQQRGRFARRTSVVGAEVNDGIKPTYTRHRSLKNVLDVDVVKIGLV